MIAILDILKINTNGTFKEEYFYESGISCISDGVKNGLWENTGNNVYKITYYACAVDEEVLLVYITFKGNMFIVEEIDESDTYITIYIRG